MCILKDDGDARYHSDSREERFERKNCCSKNAATSTLERGMNILYEREVNEIREQKDDTNFRAKVTIKN